MGKHGIRQVAVGCLVLSAVAVSLLSVTSVWATPSGLNNIPMADVAGLGDLVLQGFSNFGQGEEPAWFAGLKYGPAKDWELGVDTELSGPGFPGGLTLQMKYRARLSSQSALALGAANISDSRSKHGEVFPYAVASADLGGARGHLGCSWQDHNNAWFLGLDGPVGRKVTLRADRIQTANRRESLTSLGFIAPVKGPWLVEGWASLPTASGAETTFTLKFDYVIHIRR